MRPGGVVALASWQHGGWSSAWRDRVAEVLPGAGGPSPAEAWGDVKTVERRLTAAGLDAEVSTRSFAWRFPSVEEAVAVLTSASPPHATALARGAAAGVHDELLAIVEGIIRERNDATDGTCSLPAPWLLSIARRP